MKKILVAGATGQLGRLVVLELKHRGYAVHALARNPEKLSGLPVDKQFGADLSRPERLRGVCDGIEAVISCAGASMNMNTYGDRTSFFEIDHRGNANLLAEAKRASVKKFIYVSLAEAARLRQTEYADAHERFVAELAASGVDYSIIRPTGFFGFHLEILKYAAKGLGLVIGTGECRTNPVHEADVARAAVDALDQNQREIAIGGPEVFTRKETVELAFAAIGRSPRLLSIPPGLFKVMIAPLKLINPRIHALMDFGIAVTQIDVIAPQVGRERLQPYFEGKAGEF